MKKKCLLALLLPTALTFSGCGTPAEIKATLAYAQFQTEATDLFPKIADDVYQSCLRSIDYIILDNQAISGKKREEREATCNNFPLAAKEAYTQNHQLIIDYLESLGQLAADDITNFDASINKVGESIKKLPGLNNDDEAKNAVTAGTVIVRILSGAVANGYRRNELKTVIVDADPNLKTLAIALDQSVKNYYVNGQLVSERDELDSYYKRVISAVNNQATYPDITFKTYVIQELKAEWSDQQNVIREKQDLSSSYLTLLQGIACDHSNLKNMFLGNPLEPECKKTPGLEALFTRQDKLSPDDIVLLIESYSREVTMLNQKADKLFGIH